MFQYALDAWQNESAGEQSLQTLSKLGYSDTAQVQRWLELMRRAPAYARLNNSERDRVDAIIPDLLAAAAACQDPDSTLRGCLNLVERLQQWPGYLSVLVYPGMLQRLVGLVGASPWLAQFLYSHPELLDRLLGEQYLECLPSVDALRAALLEDLSACAGDEAAEMIALRKFKHNHVLHIVSLDLEGLINLDEVSKALSDLADLLLGCVVQRVSGRMGLGRNAPLGIIAYGKLGSREMTYSSDTDIVFVYDERGDVSETVLARLARSVNHWLTEPTAAGVLYATDFRLRPHGESGLLVGSISAFSEYQRKHAWTWEHQALTRARWIAGDEALCAQFQSIRREMLLRERDGTQLSAEVVAMRERIEQSKLAENDQFNVKHSRGGIIDVEFAVQHLVLRHARLHPELVMSTDNESILTAAARIGLIPAHLAGEVALAFRLYRSWMHRERLRGNETILVSPRQAEPHRDAVLALWRHSFESSEMTSAALAA